MMNALPLAALEDWLKFIVPLVFFVIWALNQLIAASKVKPKEGRAAPPRRKPEPTERPLRPVPPPANPAGQQSGQAQLNAEIEQFLKRAGQRRGEKQPRQQAATKAPPKAPPRPPREEPVDVEPVSKRDDVARSVEKHLGNRGFSQRAEHLAEEVARADQQMEEHLQQAFSHKVGTLGGAEPPSETPLTDTQTTVQSQRSAMATAIAGILADPQNIRQMIVLKEILDRPESRW
jgi:hypothetical protein